jgi:hypothetical protein
MISLDLKVRESQIILPDQGFLGRSTTASGTAELLSPSQATDLLPAATASNDGKMTAAQAGKLEQFSTESEYVRLGGRAGGQILYLGLNSGDYGAIHSNPSKNGLLKFGDNCVYDDVNRRLGVNQPDPTATGHFKVSISDSSGYGLKVDNSSGGPLYYSKNDGSHSWNTISLSSDVSGDLKYKWVDGSVHFGFKNNAGGMFAEMSNGTIVGLPALIQGSGAQGFVMGTFSNHPFVVRQNNSGVFAIGTNKNISIGDLGVIAPFTATARVQIKGATSGSSGYGLKVDGSTAGTKNFYVRDDGRLETRDGGELSAGTTIGFKIGISASEKLGFFGVTPVAQQNALTASLTTLTYTAPGTPDYTIQDLTSSGGYGFATQDEGNTVLSVIKNLQVRVNELETRASNLGLITQ